MKYYTFKYRTKEIVLNTDSIGFMAFNVQDGTITLETHIPSGILQERHRNDLQDHLYKTYGRNVTWNVIDYGISCIFLYSKKLGMVIGYGDFAWSQNTINQFPWVNKFKNYTTENKIDFMKSILKNYV